ncbi:hypothetical protein NGUA38_00016 [Salmonella enterica]|nr:hypothetical protein NGUA38_00016 [Salmonella enterica]
MSSLFKEKTINTSQIITLLPFYWLIYSFCLDHLYANASKGPASIITEIYLPAALLAHVGLLFLFIPYYLIWKVKEKFNWRGFVNVHRNYPLTIFISYTLATITYMIAYKASFYGSDINTSNLIQIIVFLFASTIFLHTDNKDQ